MRSRRAVVSVVMLSVGLLTLARPSSAGDEPVLSVTRHEVRSEALDRRMGVVVHLPAGYADGQERYPVCLHLGAESRARLGLLVSTLTVMAENGEFPSVIIVGIELPEGNGVLIPPCSGRTADSQADGYLRFLIDELLPFVERTYRTHRFRLLAGASNSGLFTIHALLEEPDVFDAYFAWSPALGWCSEQVVSRVQTLFSKRKSLPGFLDVSYGEEDYEELVRSPMPAFVAAVGSTAPEGFTLKVEEHPRAGHVPVQGYYGAPKALLPELHPPRDRVAASLRELTERYATVSARLGFEVTVPPEQLFSLGADYVVIDEDFVRAEEAFQELTKLHPSRADGYSGMAFACLRKGELEEAARWLERALRVDPDSSFARRLEKRISDAAAQAPE